MADTTNDIDALLAALDWGPGALTNEEMLDRSHAALIALVAERDWQAERIKELELSVSILRRNLATMIAENPPANRDRELRERLVESALQGVGLDGGRRHRRDAEGGAMSHSSQEAWQNWWDDEGSAMRPLPNEDTEQFARRMTEIAWANGAFWRRPDIDRLRAELVATKDELATKADELAAMQKQRDEARRDACLWALPKGVVWNDAMLARGKAIAAERGWDCFAQNEGGGA